MMQRVLVISVVVAAVAIEALAGTESGDRQKAVIHADGKLWEATQIDADAPLQAQSVVSVTLVTLDCSDMSIGDTIRYICMASGRTFRVEADAVVVRPRQGCLAELVFQVFRVSGRFPAAVGGRVSDTELREYLTSLGVAFAREAKLHYDSQQGLLFVRNTPQQLRSIEKVLECYDVLESSVFEIERPLPPPPLDVAWKSKLDIIIPHLVLEEVPVGTALLRAAQMAKKADPEGKGINVIYVEEHPDFPAVFTEEEWLRHVESFGAGEDEKGP